MFGVELAAVVQQRRSTCAVAAAFNFTDKNHVIALGVLTAVKAFKAGSAAGQQWCTGHAVGKSNAIPAVVPLAGKTLGQALLVSGQDVDGIVRARTEGSHGAGRLRQAPQHQRRIQRDGIERIGGQSNEFAGSGARGHDGHAGCKHCQTGTKLGCGKPRCLGFGGGNGVWHKKVFGLLPILP